ncbi:unnamed protein product, partial [marine sediment metagenome]
MEPAQYREWDSEDLQPTDEDLALYGGCNVVVSWGSHVNRSRAERHQFACASCPLHTGKLPRHIQMYE